MKYIQHYESLIGKRRQKIPEGYSESHHIFPCCQGGPDAPDNLVNLTAKEHFVAHLLLVKIYPEHKGLLSAANMMSNFKKYNSRKYLWLKEKFSKMMSERIISDETRKKMSEAKMGKKRGPPSEETRMKISEALKGRKMDDEHREKCRKNMTGKKLHKETRKKMSDAKKRQFRSEEWCQKISESLILYHLHKN